MVQVSGCRAQWRNTERLRVTNGSSCQKNANLMCTSPSRHELKAFHFIVRRFNNLKISIHQPFPAAGDLNV